MICEDSMSMHNACCNKQDKPIKFPLWQMVHQEKEAVVPEDEEKNDRFNCLTSRVRACYLRNLEKVLLNNYEMCSNEERSEFPYSKENIVKAAEQLECRALCSCMVVILYQRAMMRLTSDIKKHTQQLKLYRRLQEIVNSNYAWHDKEIQTTREDFLTDGVTQTDASEIPIIKSEPPEPPKKPMIEASCSAEPQPIPVLVSGVAMTKNFSEPSGPSTSSQVTNHDKENLMPTKEKAYYKRNTKDLSKEPKINSPPKKPCLRVKSLSSLQKPFVKNGAVPLEIIDEYVSEPVVTDDTMPLEIIDERISKSVVTNNAVPLEMDERLSKPVVTNGALPLENIDEHMSKPVVRNDTMALEMTDERLSKPVLRNGTTPLKIIDDRVSKQKIVEEAVPDIPLPPSPAHPAPPIVEDRVSDDGSSPRMSIEERLSLVFNIPTETTAQASTPSERHAAAKGRRMSIEERLEAVFRGETINDEDVQSEDGAEQANESMETLKNEEHVVAPPRLKLKLIELFGHESDGEEEDNEPPYKDKIARWVVECLMPYYRLKLIANRPLFKRLARHIADTVMLTKPLPDKSDVDDCVTEFFSNHSCVSSKRDII